MDKHYDKFLDRLESISDWAEEYNTQHYDAGSNYAHLPSESGITADDVNRWSEDYRYPDKHKLTEDELCEIIQSGDFDMVPGSICSLPGPDRYVLDYYPVGEIVEQIEYSQFEDLGITESSFHRCMALECKRNHYCLGKSNWGGGSTTYYLYINTDAVWRAVHTRRITEEAQDCTE